MEFRIQEYKVPEQIDFNYEELRNEIQERVSFYKDLVYTDSQMREAKADRARLRKVIDAIDTQRKQVKADLLHPYTQLEQKLDEIKALIQEPINMIDNQVKAYEELQKQTKTESIQQTWMNIAGPFDLMTIWNPKWLNTTYSMKKITEEMHEAIQKYNEGMETLEKLDEYSFEAIERFRQTLDLGQAMVLVNDLKEQAKRKKAYEEEMKHAPNYVPEMKEPDVVSETTFASDAPDPRKWITFTAYLSYKEALCLEDFLNGNSIEFRKGV